MSLEEERVEARAPDEAVLMAEVRYAIVFAEMNEVVNMRLHKLCVWITTFATILTVGGAAAVITKYAGAAGFTDALTAWTLVVALVAAAAEATKRSYKFDQQAEAFRKAKQAFQDLEARGWSMNLGSLQKEIAKLRKGAPSTGEWLASAAFNKACAELGYPERHRQMPRHIAFLRSALAG